MDLFCNMKNTSRVIWYCIMVCWRLFSDILVYFTIKFCIIEIGFKHATTIDENKNTHPCLYILQLLHRDLAARNVLLGDGMVCKIADFGLARDVAEKNMYYRTSMVWICNVGIIALLKYLFSTKNTYAYIQVKGNSYKECMAYQNNSS